MKKILFIALLFSSIAGFSQSDLSIPYSVRVKVNRPTDAWFYNKSFVRYTSTAQVLSEVGPLVRYDLQRFNVNGIEYVFKGGIADANLQVYIPGIPDQTGHSGQFLTTDGTNLSWISGGGGSYSSSNGINLSAGNFILGGPLTNNTSIPGAGFTWTQTGLSVHTLGTSNGGVTTTELRNGSGYSLTNVDANSSDNASIHLYTGGFSGSTAVDITSNNGFLVTTSGDVNVSGGVSGGSNSASSVVIRNYLLNVSKLFTAKQRFTVNSTNAGINLGTFAGDPSTLVNGDIWYNSSIPSIRARVGGSTVSLGAGGGSSYTVTSPITLTGSDIGITNSQADASTKGAATFTTNDFNDNGSGTISLDYTNAQKATTSVPGLLSAADFTTFNNKNGIVGDVYSEDFSGGLGNYTPVGTGYSINPSSGMLIAGGTLALTTNKIVRSSFQTSYDKFYRIVRFTVGANVSGEAIGIGVSPNSVLNPALSVYATFNTASTTNRGQVKIHGVQGSDLVKATSASNLSYTNGDVISMKLTFSGPETFDVLVTNETVPISSPVHVQYASPNLTSSDFFGVSTFTTVLYPLGATWTVKSDVFGSTSPTNPTLIRIGDSITQGHGSDAPAQRDANILNQLIPGGVSVFAGGGNVSLDVLNTLPQVIAMKPKYVAMMIGINDIGNSVSLGDITTSGTYLYNVNQIVRSLIANNIIPIILYITPITGSNTTINTWNAALLSTFGNICSVQNWASSLVDAGELGTRFSVDGLHINALAYSYLANAFIAMNPQFQAPKQFGRYPTISFDGADLTVDALAGTGTRLTTVSPTGKFGAISDLKYTQSGLFSQPTLTVGSSSGVLEMPYAAGQAGNIIGTYGGVSQIGLSIDGSANYGGTDRTLAVYDYISGGYISGWNSNGEFVVGHDNSSFGAKIFQNGNMTLKGLLNFDYTSAGGISLSHAGTPQFYLTGNDSGNYGGSANRTISVYDGVSGGYRWGINADGTMIVGNSNSTYGFKATQDGDVTFKGLTTGFAAKSANYTVTATDHVINCLVNSFAITFPTGFIAGKEYVIYNSGSATTITLTPSGSDTINGAASGTVTTGGKTLVYDGVSNWIMY